MIQQIFGLPIYIGNIKHSLYNKDEIIKDIHFNYNKDKNRNNWTSDFEKSDLHHSFGDWENSNFKKINFNKLIPIYEKEFKKFFNLLPLKKSITFKFNIVNYTCMTSSQFMKEHYHPDTDFTAVHYIKFDKKIHKPTVFENSNAFSSYSFSLKPSLINILNEKNIYNSWFFKNYCMDIKENDICITPGFLLHSVPTQPKTNSTRITIVSNIKIE